MERYGIAEAAERAATSVEELRQLVELGILQPDADDRFSEGDVRRVGIVHSLVAASMPLDLLSSAMRSGDLSLDFVDDPSYSHFAAYAGETFEELSARTGSPPICWSRCARRPARRSRIRRTRSGRTR